MDSEGQQPYEGYRYASFIVPLVGLVIGGLFAFVSPYEREHSYIHSAFFIALGGVLGGIFFRWDHLISAERKRVRKGAKSLLMRCRSLKNLIGVEAPIAPSVGNVLEQGAAIYMRHVKKERFFEPSAAKQLTKAESAIEAGMARLLDLASPPSAALQEVELSQGWALQVLKEMQALDTAIARQGELPAQGSVRDTLLRLRDARGELEDFEAARVELDQS